MKIVLKATLIMLLLSAALLHATSVSVGSADSGNCYPFMCQDTGSNVGQTFDYQEAYVSSAFSGPFTVTSMSWGYWPGVGTPTILGGSYAFYWGYSGVGLGLSSSLASNYSGAANYIGTATVPAGGSNFGSTLTLSGFSFTYNPGLGDLIVEVVVSNQDSVCNGCGNGYNWADYTGTQVVRAYCETGQGCYAGTTGALDTTFNGQSAVPEPSALVMFGSGLLGLAGFARRKFML